MFRLALRTLRFRKGGFVASFIALFFGAVIVMACGGLMETGIRTEVPPHRLAAAPVVVAGDQSYRLPGSGDPEDVALPERVRLDPALVAAVRAVPGVARAVPDVSFPVTVLGSRDRRPIEMDERPAGHGWASASLAPYTLAAGRAPGGPGEVVLDASLATRAAVSTGGDVQLTVRGTAGRFRVTGLTAGGPGRPPGVFFSEPQVRQVAAQIDAIGVFPAAGTSAGRLRERIDAALGGHDVTVSTGNGRGSAEFADAAPGGQVLIVMAGVFGGLAIMIVVFVVASTLGLSVQQRQREMALLRIIGTTPGQLRRMILGEAVVVSMLAVALAQPLGNRPGRMLFDRLTGHDVAPAEIAFHQGWIPSAAAAGIGLLIAVVAAFAAVRGAAAARPSETLTEASLQNRRLGWFRLVCALVCLAGATALALVTATVMSGPVAASTASPLAMLTAAGLALLGPRIAPVVTTVLGPALRPISGNAGRLALLNLRARRIRTAAAIAPVMLVTGLATGMIYLQTSQTAQAEREFTESLRADAVVTSTSGGLPLSLVDAVRKAPGVSAASALVTSRGYVEAPRDKSQSDEGLPLRGVSPQGAAATTAVSVTAGTLADLRGDTAALDAGHARRLGLGVGDTVTMRLGDGAKADLRIVALFSGGPRTGLVPAPLLAAHTTAGVPSQILLRTTPGTDRARLTADLTRLAGGAQLRVADRNQASAAHAEQEQIGAWVNYMFVGMLVGYTAISLVNTLIIAAAERRGEFGLQRLIGFTRGQILRTMGVEAIIIAIAGILLGGVVSTVTLVPFGIALNGSPTPGGSPWIYLTVIGSATALTLLATLLSSWSALRPSPVSAAARQT